MGRPEMSQSQSEAHKPQTTTAKRKRSARLPRSPSPSTDDSPPADPPLTPPLMAKRQRNAEVTAADQQPPDIVDIDPEGDLTILFESRNAGFKVDSNAIRRSSQILYEQCLAVRPADGSAWTFQGVLACMQEATGVILNVVHGNIDQTTEPMDCILLHHIICFTNEYGMTLRLLQSLKQWFLTMKDVAKTSNTPWQLYGLWIARGLGLKREYVELQFWAVFNLIPDGKGGMKYPYETSNKYPVDMAAYLLFDVRVKDRIMRRRFEAVNCILKRLQKAQLELIPDVKLREDGKVEQCFEKCRAVYWNYSFPILLKSLLRPQWLHPTRWKDFPSLLHVTVADEYNGTLQQLCDFISDIQGRLCPDAGILNPPVIDIRNKVESQVRERLESEVRERLERPFNAVKTE